MLSLTIPEITRIHDARARRFCPGDVLGTCNDEGARGLKILEVRDDVPGEPPRILCEPVHTGHCSQCRTMPNLDAIGDEMRAAG